MHDDPHADASDPGDLTQRHVIPPAAPATPDPVAPATPDPVVPSETDAVRGAGRLARAGPTGRGGHRAVRSGGRAVHARRTATRRRPSPVPDGRARGRRARRSPRNAGTSRLPARPRRLRPRRAAAAAVAAAARSSRRPCWPRCSLRAAPSSRSARPVRWTDRRPGAGDRARRPTPVPPSRSTIDESSATIAVAAKVSPAVVRITVTGASNSGNSGVIPATGVGSGVIFDSNGWILTNHHVVEGGEKFDVELKDGRVLSGKVYGIDTLTDLAIVKVDATDLPTAAIGESDALKVGQLVVAIGSPLGHVFELGHQRHRVGQGPLDHHRQQRVAVATSSRPTPPSTRATRAARCSTRTATSSASTPRSPRTATASASPSRSTSPGRSWPRPSPASR